MSRGRAVTGPATLFELFNLGSPDATDWQLSAVCGQVDPEVFYPESGQVATDAKRVCGSCPVRVECLEDALARRDFHGVRGGKSVQERYAIARQRRAVARGEAVAGLGQVA